VLVGRIRPDTACEGLALWIVNNNLRKEAGGPERDSDRRAALERRPGTSVVFGS
jgi:aspartate-semialdehyde dehydrogenase